MKITQPIDVDKNHRHYKFLEGHVQDDLFEALRNCSNATLSLYKDLSEEVLNHSYAAGKWTVKQLLKHIIDSERFFTYCAFSFSRGEKRDSVGFDEDDWSNYDNINSVSLDTLLLEYKAVRKSTELMFQTMDLKMLDVNGIIGGVFYSPRMLGWVNVGHNLHHLKVIRERYL